MQGFEQFLSIFGHFTISEAVIVIAAVCFIIAVYRKIADYLMKKHDAAQERDAQITSALDAVKKYPEYRQQSIDMQNRLEGEITDLQKAWHEVCKRLTALENKNKERELNKLRDILIERYRYYTDDTRNPKHTWSTMEAEAFWALFRDYEELGGNDYMHTTVQPAMQNLKITEV